MPFHEYLRAGRFAVALEITPPQRELPGVLLRRARLLGELVHGVNVIQRPGRQSSLDASLALSREGIEPVWHLVTRGRTRESIREDLARGADGGIRQVLTILGDHAAADSSDTPTIREAIAMCIETLPGAVVGATLNQYAPDRAAVLRNLLPKVKAGASYVQTQPVFDLGDLESRARQVEAESPETKIVAMAMPLLSLEAGEKIEARLNIRLPDGLRRTLEAGDSEAAWRAFDTTMHELAASDLVDGVALMTFEMDAPDGMGARIAESIRRAVG